MGIPRAIGSGPKPRSPVEHTPEPEEEDNESANITGSYNVFLASAYSLAQTDAIAPTADKLTPQQIDSQRVAANGKYDAERKRLLSDVDKAVATGPFREDWQSLRTFEAPEWFRDAKFGIFIHWGVYSVAGFGSEWYSREMYQQNSREFAHHVSIYGSQAAFGYKDLIPKFTAPKFDPAVRAKLFHDSGARYEISVVEHHDGFRCTSRT